MRDVHLKPVDRLIEGLNKLRNSVGVTLGPKGQNVLIEPELAGHPTHTKDGVTVARSFDDEDPVRMAAARTIITASLEMNSKVGDGTTSVVILACELAKHILSLPTGQRRDVLKHVEMLYDGACKIIEDRSEPIEDTEESLLPVAQLACNHREDLAEMVAHVVASVGADGVATFRQSRDGHHKSEVTTGFHFDRGFLSPYFASAIGKDEWDFEDCYVLVFDGVLSDARSLLTPVEVAFGGKKNIILIAQDVVGEALATAVVNNQRGRGRIVAVKAPKFGQRRVETLQDIALATGGKVYNETSAGQLAAFQDKSAMADILGTAERVIVSNNKTVIVGGGGDEDAAAARADKIRAQLSQVDDMDKMHMEERLARLSGGVGTIHVGGRNDAETKSNMFLVEDGIHACFAALKKGVIPAGGVAYKWAVQLGEAAKPKNIIESVAQEIFVKVMEAPLKQLISNALESGSAGRKTYHVIGDIMRKKQDIGYDILTNKFVDFRKAGLVEPSILPIEALRTSLGCGSTLGAAAAVVSKRKEK